jgi:hypothetical protein
MRSFHVVAACGIAAPRGPGMRGGPDRFVRLYEDEEAQAAGIERYRGSEE